MVAKGGHPLLAPDAVGDAGARLLPLATLITPNLPEAEALLGRADRDGGGRCARPPRACWRSARRRCC